MSSKTEKIRSGSLVKNAMLTKSVCVSLLLKIRSIFNFCNPKTAVFNLLHKRVSNFSIVFLISSISPIGSGKLILTPKYFLSVIGEIDSGTCPNA